MEQQDASRCLAQLLATAAAAEAIVCCRLFKPLVPGAAAAVVLALPVVAVAVHLSTHFIGPA